MKTALVLAGSVAFGLTLHLAGLPFWLALVLMVPVQIAAMASVLD